MNKLIKNSEVPHKGDVALLHYDKSGLDHVAIVEWVFDDNSFLISECNYIHGECGIRHLTMEYKNLKGFYENTGI